MVTIYNTTLSATSQRHFSDSLGGVKIGNDCWIGAKATILDGTVIGDHCIVAAGAVVKGVFPDNVIIGGVPARIIKYK